VTRGVPLAVAAVAAILCFTGLGTAPFIDPPEGFHAEIAREMLAGGDFVTPRPDGVRYVDKPPLTYWLMAAAFAVAGPTPVASRFWPAAATVGCAALTAWLGTRLANARVGLVAGVIVVANLGVFVYGRLVKPDLPFTLTLLVAWTGFAIAHAARPRGRRFAVGVGLFHAGLGLAAITKDILGAIAPVAVALVFLWLIGERSAADWFPWWGVLIAAAIAVPWYVAVEVANPGVLWYTIVDNHILNIARQRVFPDEDVPLGPVAFLVVTAVGFLPWTPSAVIGAFRALRPARPLRPPRPAWSDTPSQFWLLVALWAVAVVVACTVSPFRLPHYGLPAVPAVALLAARAWDDAVEGEPDAPRPMAVLLPLLVAFLGAALGLGALALGLVPLEPASLASVDVATRNVAARGAAVTAPPWGAWAPVVRAAFVVFAGATVAVAIAVRRRTPTLGLVTAVAAMLAFLPIASQGMAEYARSRSLAPIVEALAARLAPDDAVFHEGALENSGTLLLALGRPVRVVDGLRSNLAFGATFSDSRDVFWDAERLRAAWTAPGRRFLVSTVDPGRSVIRALPSGSVHRILSTGGRHLYANIGDRRTDSR
jgi:4-amino-4-deoxy-L-arabinose transferase-like glycosyltransferase